MNLRQNPSMSLLCGHHGLRGDLAINIPAINRIFRQYPDIMIDMPIHRQFADMAPLFLNHPTINSVVITDEYEHFPNDKDRDMIKQRRYTHILNPMARHKRDDWWRLMHQTSAVLFDYSDDSSQATLTPAEQQINLVKWFETKKRPRAVAFAPFAGYAYNKTNDKMLTEKKANAIVKYLEESGCLVYIMGGRGEPILDYGIYYEDNSYFDSVKIMLECEMLIHTDTGMGWICSGYQHKQLGLYGHRYYGKEFVKNIQPVNPNAMYLDADNVNDIPDEDIFAAIDKLLV